eukprot:2010951-Rhodomonas_salina.3
MKRNYRASRGDAVRLQWGAGGKALRGSEAAMRGGVGACDKIETVETCARRTTLTRLSTQTVLEANSAHNGPAWMTRGTSHCSPRQPAGEHREHSVTAQGSCSGSGSRWQ